MSAVADGVCCAERKVKYRHEHMSTYINQSLGSQLFLRGGSDAYGGVVTSGMTRISGYLTKTR